MARTPETRSAGRRRARMVKPVKAMRPELKVLVSSGYTPDSDVARGLAPRVDGFLQKSFELPELKAAVAKALGGGWGAGGGSPETRAHGGRGGHRSSVGTSIAPNAAQGSQPASGPMRRRESGMSVRAIRTPR